jgi:geranylgeranyl diphosphate synthase type II
MHLMAYLDACREQVRAELQAMLPADTARTGGLYELMLKYPLRYGKALRPALSIAICRARGGSLPAILPTAAVLELYHNAFLVHDDIEDQSELRRSEPTLHREYGLPIAVNVGDGMLAMAIQPLLDNIERVGLGKALTILQIVSRMARETAEGQMIELDWVRSGDWTHADVEYVRLVYKKSAWYSFVAPILVGAVAAGLSESEVKKLGRMAIPLGIAFQIQDDILNLCAARDSYGKDHCGDLWEGKHTLILIHALRAAAPDSRRRAVDILRKPQPTAEQKNGKVLRNGSGGSAANGGGMPRDKEIPETSKSEDEVAFLRELIDECGSIHYARAIALKYARRFERDLRLASKAWTRSIHKDFLQDLAEFTIARNH